MARTKRIEKKQKNEKAWVCAQLCFQAQLLKLPAGGGDTCIASPPTKLAIHGGDISAPDADVPARLWCYQAVTLLFRQSASE